jgi:biopolymer transport protein ExbD
MKLPRPHVERDDSAQMLPLINIVFLLLVFFLLAGSLRQPEAFHVEPPVVSGGEPGERETALLIGDDGALAWGAAPLAVDELAELARRWRDDHGDAALPVRASARAEAAQVLAVLEQLRAAGVDSAQLVVRQPAAMP